MNIKSVIKPMALITLALSSTPLLAQGFLNLEVGQADYDIGAGDTAGFYKIGLGLDMSDQFSAQVAYVDFGEASAEAGSAAVDGISAGFALAIPLPTISLVANAGIISWDAGANDGTDLTVGIGLDYAVSKKISAVANYQHYDLDENSVSTISFGVKAAF